MKNKFFLRRLWHFFLLLFIPTLLLFVTFMHMSSKQIQKELLQEGEQSARAVMTNLELVVDNAFAQNENLTGIMRMSMALRHALRGEELSYSDVLYIDSMGASLRSMVEAYDYVESSYIYLNDGIRIISSHNGLAPLESVDDLGWLDVYHEMEKEEKSCIAPYLYQEGEAGERKLLTVCQRLLLHKGCMVLNLNVDSMQKMMDNLKQNRQEMVYLVDARGSVLASSTPLPGKENQWMETFEPERFFQEDGWKKVDGYEIQTVSQEHEKPEFYVISAIHQSVFWQRMTSEFRVWFMLILLDVVIVTMLAYFITSRSFSQINTLLEMFDNAEHGNLVTKPENGIRDEYDVILNNIVTMFLNSSYLQLQLKEKETRQENAELMALQLQINPHFLYNTLQTLDIEERKQHGDTEISRIIGYVSDILKYALGTPNQPVELREEIDYLKKYAEVQQYRFGSFIIYYEIDEEVKEVSVFRLMLQPVVENSLMHGVRNLTKMGYVKVYARKKEDWLHVGVVDNGVGMSKEKLNQLRKQLANNEGTSIGLLNLNRRLQLRYGEKSTLRIRSIEGMGTEVSFTIPLQLIAEGR